MNVVLVTSGAGFIGSHIVDELVRRRLWVVSGKELELRGLGG